MPVTFFFSAILFLFLVPVTYAAPIFGIGQSESEEPVSTVLAADADALLVRPARLAQIAYCSTGAISAWKCPSCEAFPDIKPIVVGGDDGLIPVYYIAHDPNENSVIVSHQGTDDSNILSILNDVQLLLVDIDKDLFPGADTDIQVHAGFQKTFNRTAEEILGNVTDALKSTGAKKVEVIGHSLGAAIAVMDSVFLRQNLDRDVEVVPRVFGLPRGGNQEWADFVDKSVPDLIHVHNKDDPVGIVPSRILGYQHPSGEIRIQGDNSTVNCPGQENQDERCLDGQELLAGLDSFDDHRGPYFQADIRMGKGSCNV